MVGELGELLISLTLWMFSKASKSMKTPYSRTIARTGSTLSSLPIFCSQIQKTGWRPIPACIWWTVWKGRNSRVFEDGYNSFQNVKMNCILLSHFRCKESHVDNTESSVGLSDFF